EDGIRDFHATGVQTCALPIFAAAGGRRDAVVDLGQTEIGAQPRVRHDQSLEPWVGQVAPDEPRDLLPELRSDADGTRGFFPRAQIGRASWRESAQISAGAAAV